MSQWSPRSNVKRNPACRW